LKEYLMDNSPKSNVYRSLFWPLLLIGVGVVYLLGNAGVIEAPTWGMLWRLWPLALVAVGLDLIFGRRSPVIGGLLGLLVVAAVVVFLIAAPSLDLGGEAQTVTVRAALDQAESAEVFLDLDQYATEITALVDSTDLIYGELDTYGDIDLDVSGSEQVTVHLKQIDPYQDGFNFDLSFVDMRWDIGLTPSIPLDLNLDIGSGSADLWLEDLQLSELFIDSGSGSVEAVLPSGEYPFRLDSGSGSVDLSFSEGLDSSMRIDTGSGSIRISLEGSTNATLEVDSGSGSVTFTLPDGVGLRLVVRDSGSGSVNPRSDMDLVDDLNDDDRDVGIWETPGYDDEEYQIEIIFDDAGSGSINLR
jgi:hypothetical protein